ncbi:MAG: UDP-N-acetylmuramoyl-tripeptide--D-alanyl-D-alanine ligase, partial [Spirochaetales bacterium]|nr:UDP-N-acetylmuramoyl-tripeptide--D-alanyl-D-alanine ligase [Spirochaetales bacterium]
LADISRPDIAAITNVGSAHVGMIGDISSIAVEKRDIFNHLESAARGFIHEDEKYESILSDGLSGQIRTFGRRTTGGFQSVTDLGLGGLELEWKDRIIRVALIGTYNLDNILCAVSIAQMIGVPDDLIASGLEKVKPLFGRGQVLEGPITVIQDCYNANTESMRNALEFVGTLAWTGRKILVLGSMKELGAQSNREHSIVGRWAADSNAERIFFFGEESAAAYRAALEKPGIDRVCWTADFSELERQVMSFVREGDLVLLKGSRGVELERLTGVLTGKN